MDCPYWIDDGSEGGFCKFDGCSCEGGGDFCPMNEDDDEGEGEG